MGIEAFMANLPPKKKKLIENLFSVGIIFTLIYGFITFAEIATTTGNFMGWFSSSAFMPVILLMVFFGIGYKIIKGGKINIPKQPQGQQKTQFNIPDTWGVRGQGFGLTKQPQQHQQPSKPKKPKLSIPKSQPKKIGSWYCDCGQLNIGNKCRKCGKVLK